MTTATDEMLLQVVEAHRVAEEQPWRYDDFLEIADTYWRLPGAIETAAAGASGAVGRQRIAVVDLLGRAPSSAERRGAVQALLLVLSLSDDDDLTAAVIDALGVLGRESALPALLRAASSDVVQVRASAAAALASVLSDPLDHVTRTTLLGLLDDEDEDVRDWAAFCFRSTTEWDSEEVRYVLRARCVDADPDVRQEAVRALAQRGDETAAAFVDSMLRDGETADLVVAAAADTGDARLFPALRRLWDSGTTSALLATALSWTDPSSRAEMLWWEAELTLAVHASAAARGLELIDVRLDPGFPRTRLLITMMGRDGRTRTHDMGRVWEPTEPNVSLPAFAAEMTLDELLRR